MEIDVNYEHAILLSGLPKSLVQIARDRIFEFVSSASVVHEKVDSSGMKMFFKDYHPVKSFLAEPCLHIEGRDYFIHLLITPLTIHGIVDFVSVSDLKPLVQSWGQILNIYKEETPMDQKRDRFYITGNYRVILMQSEAEQFIPQDTLRVPYLDREFRVTLYCRCCLTNGHCRLTCPKLARCNKDDLISILENVRVRSNSTLIQHLEQDYKCSSNFKLVIPKGASIGNEQNLNSAHLKVERSKSGQSSYFPGVYHEAPHNDAPCYWTQVERGKKWRNTEEIYHPAAPENSLINNLKNTETESGVSIKQEPLTSSSETDESFERDRFKEDPDESTVENDNFVNGGYMNNTALCESQDPPKCLSRTKSCPEPTFENSLYQTSRRYSVPYSSCARKPEVLSEWRLTQNDLPVSERNLQWPTNLNTHNFHERHSKFSSGPNDRLLSERHSEWTPISNTHHSTKRLLKSYSSVSNEIFLPEGRSEGESEFNMNYSSERQSELCSYVPNHLLQVRTFERPSTSNESHVPGKHSRRSSQFNETNLEQNISERSNYYFNSGGEEKFSDLYDWRKLEKELPSTDNEMSALHQRGQSSFMFSNDASSMTSSSYDDGYRVTQHYKLTSARLNHQSSESVTDYSTEENESSSEFPVSNNSENGTVYNEKQSRIDFKSILPLHLRKKRKELKELCRNLPVSFEKYTLKDENAIHDLEEVVKFNQKNFPSLTVSERNFIKWLRKELEAYKDTHAHQQDMLSLVNTDGYNEVSDGTEKQLKGLRKGKNKQGVLLSSRESNLTDYINLEENVLTPAQHSTNKSFRRLQCLKSGKESKNGKVVTGRRQLPTCSFPRYGRESESSVQQEDREIMEQNLVHPEQEQTYKTVPNETSTSAHPCLLLSGKKSVIKNSREIPFRRRRYVKDRGANRKQMQNSTPKKLNHHYGECSTSRKDISLLFPEDDKSDESHHPSNFKDDPYKEQLVSCNIFDYHRKSGRLQKTRQRRNRKGKVPPYWNGSTVKITEKCTPGLYSALQHVEGVLSSFDFQRFLSHTRRLKHPGKVLKHINKWGNIPEVVDGVISQLQNILKYFYERVNVGKRDRAEARILEDLVNRMREHRNINCKTCLCLQDQ